MNNLEIQKLKQFLINFLYRHPKSTLELYNRFGGYSDYRKMIKSRQHMEKESAELSPVCSFPDGLPIYFLTGIKYLYQTLYCIQSLLKVTKTKFKFILIDDGSFNDTIIKQITNQLPGAEVVTSSMIDNNLNFILPQKKYPYLHHKRNVYPHIKKLTDIHTLPEKGWKLVLDSDMLFWDEPTEMLDWLKSPKVPLHMVDCKESYGYSIRLMETLCDSKIKPLLNVGAIGLNSNNINWQLLENWVKELEEAEGKTYYLEQALTAMLIGNCASEALPKDKYIVNPYYEMVLNKKGTLHHYVDLSKKEYFNTAWKDIR